MILNSFTIFEKLTLFIFLPIFLILLFLIKILSKLILIRFGIFRNDVIGNSICDLDIYLVKKKYFKIKSLDFFFPDIKTPPNSFFYKLAKRRVIINSIAKIFYFLCINIKFLHKHIVVMSKFPKSRDNEGIIYKSEPEINFNKNDDREGNKFLQSIGLNTKNKFVCVLNRDDAYKKKYFNSDSIHNHNYRNSNIDDYEKSIIYLLNKGYWVFRMGKTAAQKSNIQHERFIDYPFSSFKSDFLDIWLLGNCYFCLSSSTGIDDIVRARRIPMVHVNYLPIGMHFSNQAYVITLFKSLFCNQLKRKLTLAEIIERKAIFFATSTFLSDQNLSVINNTPEEILAATNEMCSRLDGSWNESIENQSYQKKFWEILKTWKDFNKRLGQLNPKSKISYNFLKNNNWFLDKK